MRENQAMVNRIQSFLRQQHVQAALNRASSLAQQWKVQEAISKVPQLLQQWQVQEKIDRFYQTSILPHLRKVSIDTNETINRRLDDLIAHGLDLKTTSTDKEEDWKIDVIKWLNRGEVLLREDLPDEFRRLTTFAARVSPYSDRDHLNQVISERLQMLTEIRKRRRTRSV
jgi:hypothetical protein